MSAVERQPVYDLTVITATRQRPAQLATCLAQFQQQSIGTLRCQHLVVSDGTDPQARALSQHFGASYVELPEPGREVEDGEAISVVESVKAASDVYAPLTGRITEVNQAIIDDPALVNRDATGAGWFFKLALPDRAGFNALMDEDGYTAFLETL